MLKRKGFLRKTALNKIGPKTRHWQAFRKAYAEECRDEEGLIRTEPERVGLPREGISIPSPDLHHIIGRDERPDLYYDKSNLVWLTREQHQKVHDREASNIG